MVTENIGIIGSGPAGIACAISLVEDGFKGNITIFEAGKPFNERYCSIDNGGICLNCEPCNTISGFGGTIHFGDSVKLSWFPSGKRLLKLIGGKEGQKAQEKALSYFSVKEKEKIIPDKNKVNLPIKSYPITVLDQDKVKELIFRWYQILEQSENVKILFNTSVEAIKKINSRFILSTGAGQELSEFDSLIVAVGRKGHSWWRKSLRDLDVQFHEPRISIGLRFICPFHLLSKVSEVHPDFKISIQHKGIKYKTFCFSAGSSGGRIKHANHGEYMLIDGHSVIGEPEPLPYSNFAILTHLNTQLSGKSPSETKNEILNDYIEKNICYPGKPIVQKYIDFKNKEGSTIDSEVLEKLNFKNYQPGDLTSFLTLEQHEGFCVVFEKLMNEFLSIGGNDEELENVIKTIYVLGLEFEGIWDEIQLDSQMQSSVKDLYVVGDCAGIAQGILQATIGGIIVANAINS